MTEFLHWLSTEGPRVAAGVFGSVIMSLFNWEGLWVTLRKLAIGGGMAWAFGPTAILLLARGLMVLGVEEMPTNAVAASHFAVGAFGILIIETVLRVARAYRSSQDGAK